MDQSARAISSSVNADNTSNAWNVNFDNGNVNNNDKNNDNRVRCVRRGAWEARGPHPASGRRS